MKDPYFSDRNFHPNLSSVDQHGQLTMAYEYDSRELDIPLIQGQEIITFL